LLTSISLLPDLWVHGTSYHLTFPVLFTTVFLIQWNSIQNTLGTQYSFLKSEWMSIFSSSISIHEVKHFLSFSSLIYASKDVWYMVSRE
jgi:hypothetical protein